VRFLIDRCAGRRLAEWLRGEGYEVPVNLVEGTGGWTPYLSLDDAYRLDDVRDALRDGDLRRASELAERVYRLMPLEV
jgi:hypothetical protein